MVLDQRQSKVSHLMLAFPDILLVPFICKLIPIEKSTLPYYCQGEIVVFWSIGCINHGQNFALDVSLILLLLLISCEHSYCR